MRRQRKRSHYADPTGAPRANRPPRDVLELQRHRQRTARPARCPGPARASRMPRLKAYTQSAKCCCCLRPASARRLRRCADCSVFYCGRRRCRTFHRTWCSVYALRQPRPARDHHGRHPCKRRPATTAPAPSTQTQSSPSAVTANSSASAASRVHAPLAVPAARRHPQLDLQRIDRSWLFPPSPDS
jgi:hypothetical protein